MSSEPCSFIGVYLMCTNPKTVKTLENENVCSLHPHHSVGFNASYCGECGASTFARETKDHFEFYMLSQWDKECNPENIPLKDLKRLQKSVVSFAEENYNCTLLHPRANKYPGIFNCGEILNVNPKKLQCDMAQVNTDLKPLVALLKKYLYKNVTVKFGFITYES